jgi:hypothetical protein
MRVFMRLLVRVFVFFHFDFLLLLVLLVQFNVAVYHFGGVRGYLYAGLFTGFLVTSGGEGGR